MWKGNSIHSSLQSLIHQSYRRAFSFDRVFSPRLSFNFNCIEFCESLVVKIDMAKIVCNSTYPKQVNCRTKTDLNKVWLETILKKQSRDEEVYKIIKYETIDATAKGDNYNSDLTRVTMEVTVGSGKVKKLSLIIKELPKTEMKRAMIAGMRVFLKEIVMYREILPNMADIMREVCDYSGKLWTDCIEYRPYDRLVFQDLTTLGYKMNDRKLGLDYDHCLLVVRNLAKFHALSVILKTKDLIPLEIFDGHNVYQNKGLVFQMHGVIQNLFQNVIKDIEQHWEPSWKPVAERLKKQLPDIFNHLSKILERDDSKFNVLNHGDCWFNNIMFKYGIDGETPISLKFVDYQLCFYNSPAYDLQYFLSTTPNLNVRSISKLNLIEEYHKSLTKFLKLYNYEGEIITLDYLKEEVDRFSLFSVITGLLLLPLVFLEKAEDMPDIEKLWKDHIETNKIKLEWLGLSPNFTKFMKLILTEAVDNNTI